MEREHGGAGGGRGELRLERPALPLKPAPRGLGSRQRLRMSPIGTDDFGRPALFCRAGKSDPGNRRTRRELRRRQRAVLSVSRPGAGLGLV